MNLQLYAGKYSMTGSLDKSMCMNAYINLNFTDKRFVAHNAQIIIKYPIFFLINLMSQLILRIFLLVFVELLYA